MKSKKGIIVLIIILTIMMIVLSIFFVSIIQNDFKFKGLKIGLQISDELILDKTYEEKFNNIIIDASTSEIYIKVSDTEKIKAVIYGEKDYTDVTANQDTLKIKASSRKCIGFCFNQKSAKIEIYLPEEYAGNINIKNKYGDVAVAEFLQANIDIQEDCGDVKIIGGNIIKVDNNYGNIEIEKANVLTINEDCGDAIISNTNDATIKNNYGDIKIKTVNNGDIRIDNTNELFIDAKTDLGKVKINNNYNKSDITLKIENNCGDIEVNN